MQSRLIIGAASVESAEIERLRALGEQCASRLPFAVEWRPTGVPGDIDVLLIDVDTIYGHVDWLRAHSEGRALIALTSKPDGAHDHELSRSADAAQLAAVLLDFERLASAPAGASAAPVDAARAPAPDAALAETRELPVLGHSVPPAKHSESKKQEPVEAVAPDHPEPALVEPPPESRSAMALVEWLMADDGLDGPASISLGWDDRLLVDPKRGLFLGPELLKSLEAVSARLISRSEWSPESDAALDPAGPNAASVQPLARLRLIAGLKSNEGRLAPGFDTQTRFQLPRWPQIEREFPRHLRLATALMKGPANLSELSSQVDLPESEVAEFLNGFVAAGFIGPVPAASSPAAEAPVAASGRLLGRFRSMGRKA